MVKFDKKYFKKIVLDNKQIELFYQNALRDLRIAEKDSIPEVRFTYSYQALIKLGIYIIAKTGGLKVRSIPGHHIKILDKLSEVLGDPDVAVIGNIMRTKRNNDFYGTGELISKKEAMDYLKFVKGLFKKQF